jgi:hypothetical protein
MTHIVGGQRGGRLIQHQQFGVNGHRPGDRQQRFLGARQFENPGVGIQRDADILQRLSSAAANGSPVDQAEAAWESHHQRHVLRYRHPFDQPEILMNKGK